jgi:hypothetical protein
MTPAKKFVPLTTASSSKAIKPFRVAAPHDVHIIALITLRSGDSGMSSSMY